MLVGIAGLYRVYAGVALVLGRGQSGEETNPELIFDKF